MTSLAQIPAKICLTASGCLIHEEKVLLVKHKKVGSWLCPGGHIDLDQDELPHQAAEREFWEEAGVRVKAFSPDLIQSKDDSQYLPNPINSNLHWVCKDNYLARTQSKKKTNQCQVWHKGCEQHFNLMYLVKPATQDLSFTENEEETDDIAWFDLENLGEVKMHGNVEKEIGLCWEALCQV